MKEFKFQSVFDIGPVMVGPSSHTAGAVRIGKIVSAIFGETPTEVNFNSLIPCQDLSSHRVALVAQYLVWKQATDIPRALDIAYEKGIKVYWKN